MRQVPELAIIGAGRVAKHFCHYFNLIHLPYICWFRAADPLAKNLSNFIVNARCVLLLISDAAIEPFVQTHQSLLTGKTLIHCSGQLVTPLAYGAHPLMTFANKLYDLSTYQKIPFILDEGAPALNHLIPGLNNAYYYINKKQKAFYHSLCVMSGNFTCILWQKFADELQKTLQLPIEIIFPYLEQIFCNLNTNPQMALTGPLVRKDKTTITANLNALENDPFQKIYRAFVEVFNNNEYFI